jgi:hypothetical protein
LSTSGAPAELSVVLATDVYETIRPVLERLHEQTIRDRLEIVLVVSESRAGEECGVDLAGFANVRVVEVATGTPLARARAAGIRCATAPRVFIGETHSYPHPGMASALLEAHEQGWDVAVPAFGNANPEGLLSWTGFIADYGPWMDGHPPRPLDYAPFYNVSYLREVLLDLGEGLERALDHGDEMLRFLRSTDRRIAFVPDARIDHLNLSRASSMLWERFVLGVMIGGTRSRRWGWPKRLLYCGASPLIAAILAARAIRTQRPIRDRIRLPRWIVPGILGVSAIQAAGEALGYASGPPRWADEQMQEYELHKLHHVGFR